MTEPDYTPGYDSYTKPILTFFGLLSERTAGNGGSFPDRNKGADGNQGGAKGRRLFPRDQMAPRSPRSPK